MTEFAKTVAKQLDRRQRRRRLLGFAAAIGAIVLAVLYLRCGRGWGLGGKGDGSGAATPSATDAGPHRCAIRIAAHGITVDGKPATRDEAVTTCRASSGADVVVTGDARQGDWDDLRAAFEAAHVAVFLRDR